jgi:hypothetical protein
VVGSPCFTEYKPGRGSDWGRVYWLCSLLSKLGLKVSLPLSKERPSGWNRGSIIDVC